MNDPQLSLLNYEPTTEDFRGDIISGLSARPKRLPCKYFYDEHGCQLFERICDLKEYYLTRCELAIMEQHAAEMAGELGPQCMLIEYGSGSGRKTRILLDELHSPAAYIPVDIARDHLEASATDLSRQYPDLEILPVCADFTTVFDPPQPSTRQRRRVVYFPGSTIGNFEQRDVLALLRGMADLVGPGGGLLIGLDLQKDEKIIEAAYNDREGVTAEFNRNLLKRINRELNADFNLDQFEHRAVYDRQAGRVEMQLVSRTDQKVNIDGISFNFAAGESIRTEHSHKYRLDQFGQLARNAGFFDVRCWTDADGYFAVVFYETAAAVEPPR